MNYAMKGLFLTVILPVLLRTACTSLALVSPRVYQTHSSKVKAAASWRDLEYMLGQLQPPPLSIDSVLHPEIPSFSSERLTLFRERHGWCPYSERVWLALELMNINYDTVRIDNTGGGRPIYFSGETPQIRWPEGNTNGESLHLVAQLDSRFGSRKLETNSVHVQHVANQFRNIFPQRARPSSRAAFLFQGNGEPLWREIFEETLAKTDDLLRKSGEGPFFCGRILTAADIAWAPFLERYRYQLPCLHDGLEAYHVDNYPHLYRWYQAMDTTPAYACRVKGDASSWRKVLSMAGFGNSGIPPMIERNVQDIAQYDGTASIIDQNLWDLYRAQRPYLASTPQAEAGATIIRNRDAILGDALKRAADWGQGLPETESEIDYAMRYLCRELIQGNQETQFSPPVVKIMASFLDDRMCVPRDMGAMSAAAIKHIANS